MQKIKIKENTNEIMELKRIIDDHVKESNSMKIELANLHSQQSELEIEKQKLITTLTKENKKNSNQVFALDEEVCDLKSKLSSCKQQLENVETEFASYKVRAQAVLRQNQLKDSSNEDELKEELMLLKQTKEDLTTKLSQCSEQQRRLQQTINEFQDEKQNLQERSKKLLQLLDETRHQIDTLQMDNRKQMLDHQEALKTHRLQIDTLNNCFKKQIEEMKQKHEEDLDLIKATRTTAIIDSNNKENAEYSGNVSLKKPSIDEHRTEFIMMEQRQAGEGSEGNSSIQTRKLSSTSRGKHDLIPLDELLNNSFDDETDVTESNNDKFVTNDKFIAQQSR